MPPAILYYLKLTYAQAVHKVRFLVVARKDWLTTTLPATR